MTDQRDKIRGLILAALMVLSVFGGTIAFSGSAAATFADTTNSSVSPAEVSELAVNDHTFTLEVDSANTGDGNPQAFTVDLPTVLDLSSSSIANATVVAGNVNYDGTNSGVDTASNNVTIATTDDGGSTGDTIIVEFELTNVEAPSVSADTTVPVNYSFDDDTTSAGIQDGFTNVTFANLTVLEDGATTTISESQAGGNVTFYVGEVITLNASDAGDRIEIREDGETNIIQAFEPEDGVITIESENYFEGETDYDIFFEGQTDPVNVSVESLGLSAVANSTNVAWDQDLGVTISASDANRNVTVELLASNGTVMQTQNAFIDGDAQTFVNLGNLSAGDYTVRVTDDQTNIVATTGTITVEAKPDPGAGSVSFATDTFRANQGDRTTMDISFENTSTASVVLGSEASNYQIEFTVYDNDGDGEATVIFNTLLAGQFAPSQAITAQGADSVNITTQSLLGSTLDQAAYTVFMQPGDGDNDPSIYSDLEANPQNIATFVVEANTNASVKTWTARASLDEQGAVPATLSGVLDGVEAGVLVEDSTIALSGNAGQLNSGTSDLVVVDISVSGIYGALHAADGNPNDAITLQDVVSSGVIDLSVIQTEASTELNREVSYADLFDGSGISVIADDEANKLFIVMDPEEVDFDEDGQTSGAPDAGDVFTVSVGVWQPEYDSFASYDTANSTQFEFVEGKTTIESVETGATSYKFKGNLRVLADQNTTVHLSSTWAPTTQLSFRAKSNSGVTPAFFQQKTATVGADGTVSTTWSVFNTDAEPDSAFTLELTDPSGTVAVPGMVQDTVVTSTVTFNDQSSNGNSVTVEEAYLEDGGYVVIHAVTEDGAPGEVLGATGYIPPGTAEDITVPLDSAIEGDTQLIAMTHKDTDGDQQYEFPDADGPYIVGGGAVIDQATVSGPTQTATETATETETETATETMTETETETEAPTETETPTEAPTTTSGDGGPGFTAVLAVIAVLAAALLAVRRQR